MQTRDIETMSLSRKSKKIGKGLEEKSYWQEVETMASCKFGRIRNPKKIVGCYEKNNQFIYIVEDQNGKKKLVPDLILEEQFPLFMINYFEEIIKINN